MIFLPDSMFWMFRIDNFLYTGHGIYEGPYTWKLLYLDIMDLLNFTNFRVFAREDQLLRVEKT